MINFSTGDIKIVKVSFFYNMFNKKRFEVNIPLAFKISRIFRHLHCVVLRNYLLRVVLELSIGLF